MTDEELDARLAMVLAEHAASTCNKCGRTLDRGDVAWSSGSTEAGTPFSYIEVMCARCDAQKINVRSWWPEVESLEEAIDILEKDWGK